MVRPESLENAFENVNPDSLSPILNSRIPSSPSAVREVSDQPWALPMVLNIVFPRRIMYNFVLPISISISKEKVCHTDLFNF